MITAVFTDNSDYTRATGLWQWDYGQKLRIEGLTLPTAVEIHFALTEQSGDAITRVGTTKDGVTEVAIPDSLLENQAVSASYAIYAWIYLADKTSGETVKRISVWVKCRPKPEGFDAPGDAELFRDAIAQVNASADRAEAAREGAEAAKKAAEATAGKIEGEIAGAGQIAEQVKQDAAAVAKDKQAVSQMVTETTQNAQKAAESVQAAENSSTAAKEAQKAAETAEAGATAVAEEVERDRTEVSNTHRLVEQMRDTVSLDRRAVAADRQAVENTASQFEQTAQNALTAVGQAQEAAVGAVSAEGQRQTNRVQDAAAGIVADREQIAANKQAIAGKIDKQQGAENAGKALVVGADGNVELGDAQTKTDPTLTQSGQAADAQVTGREIATLHQNKADAIIETAQGETMTLTDSSDKLFEGLRVFGKSTQDGTPTPEAPVPIVSAGESGNITVEVRGKNLLQLQDGRGGNRGVEVTCRNGEISLVGTATETGWAILKVNPPVVLNGDYALSTSNDVECCLINNDYKIVIATPKPQNIVNGEVAKIAFGVTEGKIYNMNGIKVMLNRGLTASPYEPPRIPQSLTLQTPNGLPGIPVSKDGNYTDSDGQQWVCDEIDLGRGKYVQRVKDFIINQNTNISTSMGAYGAPEKDSILARYSDKTIKKRGAILCRELIRAENWSVDSESVFATENSIDFRLSRKRLGLETETTTDENKTAVLKFLETTPLHCLAELNTPIERDLTPEEITAYKALRTYSPTTVITNDAGAGMEVAYVADTKAYIDKKFKELNQAIVNTQIALL